MTGLLIVILVLQIIGFAFTAVTALSMGNLHNRLDVWEQQTRPLPIVRRASTYQTRETGARTL